MNRTLHYGLPLFEATDKPSILVDWNETMAELDNALFTIATGGDTSVVDAITALQQAVASINSQITIINQTLGDTLDVTFMNNIAPQFEATGVEYNPKDMVFHNGNLYICFAQYTGIQDDEDHFDQYFIPVWLANKVTDNLNAVDSLDTRVTALENAPAPTGDYKKAVLMCAKSMTLQDLVTTGILTQAGYLWMGSIASTPSATLNLNGGSNGNVAFSDVFAGLKKSFSEIAPDLTSDDIFIPYFEFVPGELEFPRYKTAYYVDGQQSFMLPVYSSQDSQVNSLSSRVNLRPNYSQDGDYTKSKIKFEKDKTQHKNLIMYNSNTQKFSLSGASFNLTDYVGSPTGDVTISATIPVQTLSVVGSLSPQTESLSPYIGTQMIYIYKVSDEYRDLF